jgi:hypothetical protein
VTFSTAPITSGVSGDGGLGRYSKSVGVMLIWSSFRTFASVAFRFSSVSPGITRQLTLARASCGRAFGAWPPSSIVATQVVRIRAL